MIAHYGCFEDICAVIDACPLCGLSCAACAECLSFEVDCLFSGQSVLWDQVGVQLVHHFSIRKSSHALFGM